MSDAEAARGFSQSPQSRQTLLALLALALLAIAVRLPGIERPLVGPFATKNAVYAMIARNWAEGRASLWYPTLDCLIGGRRSLHMLEWPASAYVTGALWRVFGGRLDLWGRATAIAFSTGAVALLFLLVRRWHGPTAAVAAALVLVLSPVSVLYGRAFMLEASLVFFTVATFYAFQRWLDGARAVWLVWTAAAFALLLLTKIYMLVVLLPLVVMLTLSRLRERDAAQRRGEGSGQTRHWPALVVLTLAILPAAAWYWHAAQTAAPESPLAPHVFYSVRDSANVHRPPHPLLSTPDFYRQMFDDLASVVLTPIGIILLILGFSNPAWRRHAAWLVSTVVLVAALPLKFYEMNYYWLVVLPPLAVMVGLGWQTVSEGKPRSLRAVAWLLLALLVSARYTVGPMLVTPSEDRGVVAAANAVRELVEPDEPVVTMHGSTLDLLYYCDRPGWAIDPNTPELEALLADCRQRGARYAVIVGKPDAEGQVARPAALSDWPQVASGQGYVVVGLQR